MLSERPLHVRLSASSIRLPVDRVQLVIGAQTFALTPTDGEPPSAYTTDIISPSPPARFLMALSVLYQNGQSQTIDFVANVQPDGQVSEMQKEGRQALAAARVTLVQTEGGAVVWDGSPFGQFNPTSTSASGTFAWYVPTGSYLVRAQKNGYEDGEVKVGDVSDHIVNPALHLSILPPPILLPVGEEVVEQTKIVIEQVTKTIAEIREIPQVQVAADVSVPALAVTATTSVAVLATTFNLLPYLQYLFSAPILFFGRRKRRGFGVVYHAMTKAPIDLATVRLYRLSETQSGQATVGRLVASRVTDRGGRYFFLAQPGVYRLVATKPGFSFPSSYLKDIAKDVMYLDVYHGETVTVSEKYATIAANIPVDPSHETAPETPARLKRMAALRGAQQAVGVGGILIAGAVAVIQPSMFAVGMVGLQSVVYLFSRRLARVRRPKSWGIVQDKATGRPLANVIARVFEPKYNKLLETAVSDSKGRYTFLLGPNEYFAVFERPGFRQVTIRPIDFSKKQEVSEFTQNIGMESASETPPGTSEGSPPTGS